MTHLSAEAFGDDLDAHALIGKARERFHLVHRVHRHALDVFGERCFGAKRGFDNGAGRCEIAREAALLDEEPQRRKAARASDHGVAAIFDAHDREVLQQAVRGDRRRKRFDIGALVGAPDVIVMHDELADRDKVGALRLSGGVENFRCHGIAPEGDRRTLRSAGAARCDLFPRGPRLKPAGSRASERSVPRRGRLRGRCALVAARGPGMARWGLIGSLASNSGGCASS